MSTFYVINGISLVIGLVGFVLIVLFGINLKRRAHLPLEKRVESALFMYYVGIVFLLWGYLVQFVSYLIR